MLRSETIDQTKKMIRAQFANSLTIVNLSLGCAAIIFTLQNQMHISVLFIFLAALSDRLDGMAARKFNTASDFGKELDSLSDLISFGVAPAAILFQGLLFEYGAPGILFTIIYIAAGALRLARFNVMDNNGYFTGLPITVAGSILTLSYLAINTIPAPFFMFFMLILSFLMVANFKLKKV